jgi:hypothetical protein
LNGNDNKKPRKFRGYIQPTYLQAIMMIAKAMAKHIIMMPQPISSFSILKFGIDLKVL